MILQFVESQFEIRSDSSHQQHCDYLQNEELTASERHHFSLVYGVNRPALLNTLHYFSVTSGALVPDIMHDILEGALPLEVKAMLKVHMYT